MSNKAIELWVGRKTAAWMAGLSVDRFDAVIRPRITRTRRRGRAVELDCQNLVDAIVAHRGEQTGGDPMLAAGSSPALERYRNARANIAEMESDRQRKTHVSINDLEQLFHRYAASLRRAGETLRRCWGNEAVAVYNAALDEAGKIVEVELRSHKESK